MKAYQDGDFFRTPSYPFFIDRYTIRQGEVIPVHAHSFYELVFVVEGGARHTFLGETRELEAGDVFLIEPRMPHSYQGRNDGEAVVYNVMFQLSLLDRELRSLGEIDQFVDFFYLAPFLRRTSAGSPYLTVEGRTRAQLEAKLRTIGFEDERRAPGYELIVRTQMIEFFVYLSRYMQEHVKAAEGLRREEAEWLAWVMSMLEQSYNQPVTLKQFSRMCAMSPSAFAQKFKRRTGMSFLQYKRNLQMTEACRLLRATDWPIARIAGECGCDDLSHFYRLFRRHTGVTPLRYRERRERLSGSDVR